MPEQLRQYSVFVSCGEEEQLRDFRDICIQTTWDCGHSARSFLSGIIKRDRRAAIEACDIFVRLCSTIDDCLRAECFWAADLNKRLILVLIDPEQDLEVFRSLLSGVPGRAVLISATARPYELAVQYLVTLQRVLRLLDAGPSAGMIGSVAASRNPFFNRFFNRMSEWATLDWRFSLNAALKKASAEFFFDLYLGLLVSAGVSDLFFESGSSIAFLSEAFVGRMDNAAFARWGAYIETNNIISYLEFTINQFMRVSLFPSGPPDRKYGGTFGEELKGLGVPETAHPIDGHAREVMTRIREHFAKKYTSGVLFGAASGIDLTRGADIAGPHVGTYHNMLFKRAQLEAGVPLVLFVDEDKLPRPFVPTQCFAVCDDEFSWYYACRNIPLAIVCAFRSEERAQRIIPELQYLGFEHCETGRKGEAPWPIVVSNDLFWHRRQEWLSAAVPSDQAAQRPATAASNTSRLVREV